MAHLPISAVLWWLLVLGLLVVSILAGLVELSLATIALVLVCATCELVDSTLGMGYGTTLTPLLLIAGLDPSLLVPTILVSELVSGFSAGFFHAEAGNISLERGSVHLRTALVLSLGSLVGVYGGVELARGLPQQTLVALMSAVILLAGIYLLVFSSRQTVYRTWKIVALGVVASFNKALSGGGYGPLMTSGQILSGVAGRSAVGITSLAEGFTCLAAATLYLLQGRQLEPALLIPVLAGALLTVPLSARLVRRLPEARLRRIIAVVTMGLGALSLLKALAA